MDVIGVGDANGVGWANGDPFAKVEGGGQICTSRYEFVGYRWECVATRRDERCILNKRALEL